jgi:hypothetical protein
VLDGDFQGRAHDAGLVLQLSGDNRGAQLQARQVLVGALGDAAADDEELGGEQEFDVGEVTLQQDAVLFPAQAVPFAGYR